MTINYGNTALNLGTVTSWSNSVQKRGTATPVVTQGVQNSFPIENGNSQSYTFQFKHTNGQNGMTNAEWKTRVTECIDRWQVRTDGCLLTYRRQSGNVYVDDMDLVGYIKNIDLIYDTNFNEVITGSLEFVVGRMYINYDTQILPSDNQTPCDDMFIMISDVNQQNWYMIFLGSATSTDSEYACVDSVEITAGPESPFEYATITIPRKKLMEQYPRDPDISIGYPGFNIVDGMNKIHMNVMGRHDMFVQKVRSSEDTITITAYTDAQVYTQRVLTEAIFGETPFEIITRILKDSRYGVSFPDMYIKYRYMSSNDTIRLSFPEGTLIYRVLQICAKILGCRLFFADNCAYIIDYRYAPDETMVSSSPDVVYGVGGLILRGGMKLRDACVGKSSTDETGFDPVKNYCTITYTEVDASGNSVSRSTAVYDQQSVDKFRRFDKGTIKLPELNEEQAKAFATNMLSYIREPQRSMTFTLKEIIPVQQNLPRRWGSFFTPCAMASSIEDDYNSEEVNNNSIFGGKAYHKLILSEYTRSYPKGICEYTFGMIASVELSDNLSQTSNSLNS